MKHNNNDPLHLLGKRIREIRRSKNLSQEEFADICGFDRTYISLVERGKRNLSFLNLHVFATCIGISISELTRDI